MSNFLFIFFAVVSFFLFNVKEVNAKKLSSANIVCKWVSFRSCQNMTALLEKVSDSGISDNHLETIHIASFTDIGRGSSLIVLDEESSLDELVSSLHQHKKMSDLYDKVEDELGINFSCFNSNFDKCLSLSKKIFNIFNSGFSNNRLDTIHITSFTDIGREESLIVLDEEGSLEELDFNLRQHRDNFKVTN